MMGTVRLAIRHGATVESGFRLDARVIEERPAADAIPKSQDGDGVRFWLSNALLAHRLLNRRTLCHAFYSFIWNERGNGLGEKAGGEALGAGAWRPDGGLIGGSEGPEIAAVELNFPARGEAYHDIPSWGADYNCNL